VRLPLPSPSNTLSSLVVVGVAVGRAAAGAAAVVVRVVIGHLLLVKVVAVAHLLNRH
jgi:hypothetical protein